MTDGDAPSRASTQPGAGSTPTGDSARTGRSGTRAVLAISLAVLVLAVVALVWAFGLGGTKPKTKPSPHATVSAKLPPAEAVVDSHGVVRELPYICGAVRAGLPSVAQSMDFRYSYGNYSPAEIAGANGGAYQTCLGTPPLDKAYNRRLDANATQLGTINEARAIFDRRRTSDEKSGSPERMRSLGDEAYLVRYQADGVRINMRIRNVVIWLNWEGSVGPMGANPSPVRGGLSYQQARGEIIPLAQVLVSHFPNR